LVCDLLKYNSQIFLLERSSTSVEYHDLRRGSPFDHHPRALLHDRSQLNTEETRSFRQKFGSRCCHEAGQDGQGLQDEADDQGRSLGQRLLEEPLRRANEGGHRLHGAQESSTRNLRGQGRGFR